MTRPRLHDHRRHVARLSLRTSTVNRVVNSAVYGCLAWIMRYRYPGCGRGRVAVCIPQSEGNGIDAAIATTVSLGSQLNRLAIRRNHYVIGGIPIAVAVFGFVAGNL